MTENQSPIKEIRLLNKTRTMRAVISVIMDKQTTQYSDRYALARQLYELDFAESVHQKDEVFLGGKFSEYAPDELWDRHIKTWRFEKIDHE